MKAVYVCIGHFGFALLLVCSVIGNVWSDDYQNKSAVSPFVVESAWSPAAPPMVTVRAGYFSFTNRSQAPVKIVGAQSPAFERVELHKSVVSNGVVSMSAVDSITVEVGETLEAKPGGLHLMLTGSKKTVSNTIPVVLMLSQGGSVPIELSVEVQSARQDSHSHQSGDSDMMEMNHDKDSEHAPHKHH